MANTKPRPPTLLGAAVALTAAGLLLAVPALAQAPGSPGFVGPVQDQDPTGLNATGVAAGFNTDQAFENIMGGVIGWAVGLLGLVFFLFILVGGYLWLTAGSNEEKVKKAKMIIGTSISGLLIVFLAYALASAVVDALVSSTTP